jgi:hypothetical protein
MTSSRVEGLVDAAEARSAVSDTSSFRVSAAVLYCTNGTLTAHVSLGHALFLGLGFALLGLLCTSLTVEYITMTYVVSERSYTVASHPTTLRLSMISQRSSDTRHAIEFIGSQSFYNLLLASFFTSGRLILQRTFY